MKLNAIPLEPLQVPLEGRRLIEASAGTGKTWTIAMLFLRLVVERGLGVEEILVVTFTRAATAELSRRLRERLQQAVAALDRLEARGPERTAQELGLVGDPLMNWLQGLEDPMEARRRVAEALHAMDGAAISTIHGFCARMLQEFAFESGSRLDVDILDDERAMVRRAVEDAWANRALEVAPLLLQQLIARRLGPDGLLDVAMQALSDPTVPLLPDVERLPDEAPSAAAVARWQAAWREVRITWHAGGREAADALRHAASDLDGRVYTFARIGSWHYGVARWLERDEVSSMELPEGFDRFGATTLAERTKKGRTTPTHPFFDAAQALVDVDRQSAPVVDAWIARFQRVFLDDVRRLVSVAKERGRSVSYGDLLHRLDAALHDGELGQALGRGIARRFPAILIDEFQDTDPVQFRIFSRVQEEAGEGSAPTLFLIGDPKQAIYGFRGADVLAYLQAREQTDARYTMTRNYRSDPGLLRAVASLFDGHPAPFVDPRIQFVFEVEAKAEKDRLLRPDGKGGFEPIHPLHLVFVPQDGSGRRPNHSGELKGYWVHGPYVELVANETVQLLTNDLHLDGDGGPVPLGPGDVAILVRTNAQARALHKALSERGVPAALQGDASVLDTLEAQEMEALLRALADPGDPASVRAALATRVLGHDASQLRALYQDEPRWEGWVERFHRWSAAWASSGFLGAFRRLVHDCEVPERLLGLAGGERAMTNLLHLSELLQRVATEKRLHRSGLVAWLAWARSDPRAARSELGQEADPIRLESDSGAVKLVTVHRSKGLEYPVVLLPYLGEGLRDPSGLVRFHDDDGRLTLDMGSHQHAEHAARAAEEELAESTRLLYVALTRAKQHVALFWGAFPRHGSSALAWLLHGVEGEPIRDLAERVRQLSDDQRHQRLLAVAQRAGGPVRVRRIDERRGAAYRPDPGQLPPLSPSVARRRLSVAWRVGSFSSLVHGGGAPGSTPVGEGRDVDALDGHAQIPAIARAGGGEQRVPLADWPRGAAPGTVLHGVLEVLDFQADRAARLASVTEALRVQGGPRGWAERLTDALDLAARVPFGAGEPALIDLSTADRLDFLVPAAGPSPSVLAGAFDRYATAPVVRAYGLRVASMGFPALQGLLKGFVDLVYRHHGGFGIVDYKSNYLGDTGPAYAAPALEAAMLHHDYILQYHLYVLALHRFLAARLPGYDYDRHVFGARYLFLRGMVPELGPGAGVFADRPPRALIEALDACFRGAP